MHAPRPRRGVGERAERSYFSWWPRPTKPSAPVAVFCGRLRVSGPRAAAKHARALDIGERFAVRVHVVEVTALCCDLQGGGEGRGVR